MGGFGLEVTNALTLALSPRRGDKGGHSRWDFESGLAVAAVALAGFYLGLGFLFAVGAEGSADVVGFFEFAGAAAADEAFVSSSVDEFAFAGGFLFGSRFFGG